MYLSVLQNMKREIKKKMNCQKRWQSCKSMQTNVKIAIRKSESVKCENCTKEAIKSKLLCTAATVAGIFTLQQAKIQGGGGDEDGDEDGWEDDEYNHEKF